MQDPTVRCALCRGDNPQPGPDGRIRVIACPGHTSALNRASNAAVGLDPEQEARDHWRTTGCSPALAALMPADGMHTEHTLSLRDVTALAALRILAAVTPAR